MEVRFELEARDEAVIAVAPLLTRASERLGELRVLQRGEVGTASPQGALLDELALLVVHNYEARIAVLREREIERFRLATLKLSANDAPLAQVFESLVVSVECGIADSICTIMMVSNGRLYGAAAGESMPATYMAQIEGVEVGPEQGSCGTAAWLRETVIVTDIKSDPLWRKYTSFAAAAALEACWSTPIVNADDEVLGTLGIYRRRPSHPTASDIELTAEAAHVASIAIEARSARVRLEQMALYDPLTKLPNRTLFENRMEQAIAAARRTGHNVAIGLMDLNRFKIINDSLGHIVGDQLLSEVASRLARVVRPQDTVARMGGDEFLLLMTDLENRAAAQAIADRFVAILEPSFAPGGSEIFVQGSMGVSVFPDDSSEPSELLRLADSAMYAAKASGERVAFYKAAKNALPFSRLDLEASLHGALERREFEVLFQPQVALKDGAILAAEALLRWHHPTLGVMEPERFIPIAEEVGLTVSIGAWVLGEACRFGRRWADAGGRGSVWVNVSPRQIEDARFVETVTAALESSGLPPAQLWLELTETLIMRMPENAATKLRSLRALGVRSAIDNFGRGYSSLSYLKHLPVSAIKIDPGLIGGVGKPGAATDEAIVCAILGVGRSLGLKIVAEGIETEIQADYLRRNGCPLAQGFYYAQPLRHDELIRWQPPRIRAVSGRSSPS